MTATSVALVAVAIVLGLIAFLILRVGPKDGIGVLDRPARERIRSRLSEIPGGKSSQTAPPLAASRVVVPLSPRMRLWRDTSALLLVFGCILVVGLAVAGAGTSQGGVLGDTGRPPAASSPGRADGFAATPQPDAYRQATIASDDAGGSGATPSPSRQLPEPSTPPAASPTTAPSAAATPAPRPTSDRLAVLSRCPDRADCYIYVVRQGDNLVSIANWFGVALDDVFALNPDLGDPSLLFAGQLLRLPPPTR